MARTSTQTRVATTVNDFLALPLRFPPLPSFPVETTHYLYLRPHTPKVPTQETPRQLFLVNLPIDATEVHIRSLFADQLGGGRTETVAFEGARVGKGISAPVAPAVVKKGRKRKRGEAQADGAVDGAAVGLLPEVWDREIHRSGSTAVVTFVDRASAELGVKEARKAIKTGKRVTWGEGVEDRVPPLGFARYRTHHSLRYPAHADLQASVDDFMTAFAAQESQRARALARQRQEPDEDGFITVVRGGRGGGAAREEEAKAKEEEFRGREKKRVREDFYRFQTREKNKERQRDLVREFEEDRRRVEEMRRRRGRMRPE